MNIQKGIIVAAGKATRLHPATLAMGKQLLPVYDKPMIYYPLSVLLMAGVRDILIIVAARDEALFRALLGDGAQYGVSIAYKVQPVQRGIADAFILGKDFIAGDPVCLILGDNFFYGPSFEAALEKGRRAEQGAVVFCQHVSNPRAYGVATLDAAGRVTALAEKPEHPASNWAVTGLYFYDGTACARAARLAPSARGELEITDLNISYLQDAQLSAVMLDRAFTWFDLGTHASMFEGASFVRTIEQQNGTKIGCPDEVAYKMGFIDAARLLANAQALGNPAYAAYLRGLAGRE